MDEKINFKKLFYLFGIIILSVLIIQCNYSKKFEEESDLVYKSNTGITKRLNECLKRRMKTKPPFLIDYNFSIEKNNLPKNQMSGWYIEKWKNGNKEIRCIGGGTDAQIKDHYKMIIREIVELEKGDTTDTYIVLDRYMANDYTKSFNTDLRIDYQLGGCYMINSARDIEFCHDEKLKVIAYSPINTNTEYSKIEKSRIIKDTELSVENFIKDHIIGKNGFVLFFHSTDRENFFKKME